MSEQFWSTEDEDRIAQAWMQFDGDDHDQITVACVERGAFNDPNGNIRRIAGLMRETMSPAALTEQQHDVIDSICRLGSLRATLVFQAVITRSEDRRAALDAFESIASSKSAS